MAKKKRTGHKKKMTIPVALAAPVVGVGLGMYADYKYSGGFSGNVNGLMDLWQRRLTGVAANGSFDAGRLIDTYGPIALGLGIHKFVGPSVNRALANAGIPIIRL